MALFRTATTVGPDVLIEILIAVVIGKLLSRLDALQSVYEHAATHRFRLAVGVAGMIDVASYVRAHRAVYGFSAMHLKEILAPTRVLLLSRKRAAEVFNDALALFVGTRSE